MAGRRDSRQSSYSMEPISHVRLGQAVEMEREPEPVDTTVLVAYHDSNEDDIPRFGTIKLFKPWFPTVDPQNLQAQGWLRRLSNRDIILIVHQIVSSLVFLVNLSITIFATKQHGIKSIMGDTLSGNCEHMKSYNKWLHLAINALSTLLLASSNYCAQLLVAPTREEVDDAHNKKEWFDIGIQSFRNLGKLRLKKKVTWFCLMISSGLLHLIWNSAVFVATPTSMYTVGVVTADFLSDKRPWDNAVPQLQSLRNNATNLGRLNTTECINRYVDRSAGLTDIILVASNVTMQDHLSFALDNSSSLLTYLTSPSGTAWTFASGWMCSALNRPNTFCTKDIILPNAEHWTYFDQNWQGDFWAKVDYCIPAGNLHPMDRKCALRVSPIILTMVCVLNFVKCLSISYTSYLHRQGREKKGHRRGKVPPRKVPLVTIGDAIGSFLQCPDEGTIDLHFVTRKDFEKRWPGPQEYSPKPPQKRRWFYAATARRWAITISLCTAMLVIVGVLLGITITGQKAWGIDSDISSLWSYGLGGTHLWATAALDLMRKMGGMGDAAGFFAATIFSNMFQIIFSALYLLYNNLVTVLLVAAEWNDFASERKSLRVSAPVGMQRSSYFLSLPYRFSLPLMVCSGLLHWLISQSVFVMQTIGYASPDFHRDHSPDGSIVGYSSIGILLSMLLGGTMVLALVLLGCFKNYTAKQPKDGSESPPYPMPLVSTCSAAISAACQAHADDTDVGLLPVRWGYVSDLPGKGPGRFTFTTARDVWYPSEEQIRQDLVDRAKGRVQPPSLIRGFWILSLAPLAFSVPGIYSRPS